MSILHNILLGLEIYAIAAGSLVAVSVVMSKIRSAMERSKPVFNYPADVPKAEADAAAENWLQRCIVALDIFLNVVFFKGYQGETMSTHAWRASLKGHAWGVYMNKWLNGFQDNHGPQAASGDLQRSSALAALLSRVLGMTQ